MRRKGKLLERPTALLTFPSPGKRRRAIKRSRVNLMPVSKLPGGEKPKAQRKRRRRAALPRPLPKELARNRLRLGQRKPGRKGLQRPSQVASPAMGAKPLGSPPGQQRKERARPGQRGSPLYNDQWQSPARRGQLAGPTRSPLLLQERRLSRDPRSWNCPLL